MNQNQSEAKILHSGLSHIPKALCNEKALFTLLVSGLLSVALVVLGSALSVATIIIFLVPFVILPAGASIAGILLMDQARGQLPRPFHQAVPDGISAFLRTLGIALLGIILMVVFYLFLCLLLLVCKLPVVGPALYTVLFPVMVILTGLLLFSLMAGLSVAYPAVWSGATIHEALEMLWQITTTRTAELLVNLLLLGIFIALTQFILFSVFFTSAQFVLGAAASILDVVSFSFSNFTENPVGHLAAISQSEYTPATFFGFMLGLMLFLTAIMAMGMMGLNQIYLQISKNLPSPSLSAPAWHSMSQSNGNRESVIQPASHAPATAGMGNKPPDSGMPDILASLLAEKNPTATTAKNTGAAPVCSRCKAVAQPGDRFCGECGGNLLL